MLKDLQLPQGHKSWLSIAVSIPINVGEDDDFFVNTGRENGRFNMVKLRVTDVRAKAFKELLDNGSVFKTNELIEISKALVSIPGPSVNMELYKKVQTDIKRRYNERINW